MAPWQQSGTAASPGRRWAARTSRCRPPRPLLADIAHELEEGRGLAALVSGLPVERYDEAALRRIWHGIGLHLGTPVSQSNAGLRMKVIHDEGADGARGPRQGGRRRAANLPRFL